MEGYILNYMKTENIEKTKQLHELDLDIKDDDICEDHLARVDTKIEQEIIDNGYYLDESDLENGISENTLFSESKPHDCIDELLIHNIVKGNVCTLPWENLLR